MGISIPIKHTDTTKTTEQNPQNGDKHTVVHTQPYTAL